MTLSVSRLAILKSWAGRSKRSRSSSTRFTNKRSRIAYLIALRAGRRADLTLTRRKRLVVHSSLTYSLRIWRLASWSCHSKRTPRGSPSSVKGSLTCFPWPLPLWAQGIEWTITDSLSTQMILWWAKTMGTGLKTSRMLKKMRCLRCQILPVRQLMLSIVLKSEACLRCQIPTLTVRLSRSTGSSLIATTSRRMSRTWRQGRTWSPEQTVSSPIGASMSRRSTLEQQTLKVLEGIETKETLSVQTWARSLASTLPCKPTT